MLLKLCRYLLESLFIPISNRKVKSLTRFSDRLEELGPWPAVEEWALGAPSVLRAQGSPVKIGVLHPVSGALSYSGQQGRIGAQLAIEEINAAGGIKALGGAKIEAMLGDAQSTPDGGNAEVEKMNSAGVAASRSWTEASRNPPSTKWTWASLKPGTTNWPFASITRVPGRSAFRTSALEPTRASRSPSVSNPSAHGRRSSPVQMRALTMATAGVR